ncbi:MAG: DUF1501 domain-containing protein [Planctomycetia bacterium]|nr:DUF1501 domain-containing protein [Planctomycetia bacterium]
MRRLSSVADGASSGEAIKFGRSLSRRRLLQCGLTGFSSLTLAQLLQLRAVAEQRDAQLRQSSPSPDSSTRTAIILVWLRGGASHLETFDPKPLAPAEFRGPYQTIDTNVPGIQVCELLPRLAKIADKYTLLRSMAHTGGGHPAGSLQVLAGDPDPQDKLKPILPDWMSIASHLRRDSRRNIPNYIAVNPIDNYDNFTIAGPTYLGPSYEPFKIVGDPSVPQFEVPNVGLKDAKQVDVIRTRMTLKASLDRLQRQVDQSGVMTAVDRIEQQAINLLTSSASRSAFDLSQEPDAVRDRYGRNQWGQQCLMARRLVEAGVDIVATEFDGPMCGRVQNWDDHAVNQHVFDALKFRLPTLDQAVSALIEDVYARGLDKRVLVVVTGEFGRTPRISYVASSGEGVASAPAGTVQPGRDHWPRANSMLFAGGGIRTGQVIGATDVRGEDPIARRVGPGDFLATIYRHLGIDYKNVAIPNFAGRPVPIVDQGEAISELASASS